MDPELERISRRLSKMLRHAPEKFSLTLDPEGWADLSRVLTAAGIGPGPDTLLRIIEEGDKRRFEVDLERGVVRALHGHSVDVDPGFPSSEPPELLFHGTVRRFLSSIREGGLSPGGRKFVHLSTTREMAAEVGSRRGPAVILRVAAGAMFAAGHGFQESASGVWLTAHVPPQFVRGPDDE